MIEAIRAPSGTRWLCSEDIDAGALAELVGPELAPDLGPAHRQTLELFDDFDRALLRSGRSLVREGEHFALVDADDLQSRRLEGGARKGQKPVLPADFEPGPFRDELARTLGLRAATPLAEVRRERRECCARNVDEKIVARLFIDRISIGDAVVTHTLTLAPLLGYEDEARDLAARLVASPLLDRSAVATTKAVLAAAGADETPLSPKDRIELRPDESVQQAITGIARFMLRVARQNEPGIVADVDTEFVHDYRVALRKLRSVLRLVKGAYPEEEAAWLSQTLADFARATNRLRDLDVYLLDEEAYRRELPEDLRPGLDPMWRELRRARARERARVKRKLESTAYSRDVEAVAKWLAQDPLPAGPRADRPIGPLVAKQVRKRYARVCTRGRAIQADTPDPEIHALRIECKRLRYLLELFSSLFPEADLRKVVKRLKGLQDILGRFNDSSVQGESMRAHLENGKELDPLSAAAIGGLVTTLSRLHTETRREIGESFAGFDSPSIAQAIERLCRPLRRQPT